MSGSKTISQFDIYCERTASGLEAEPFNLVTNLAFIIAAWAAQRMFMKYPAPLLKTHWDFALLIGCLFAIGIGSALWHAYPTGWTVLADVIPIILFINVFLLSFLVRVGNCNGWQAAGFFLVFQLCNYVVAAIFPRDMLNGSIAYLPAYGALLACTGYLLHTGHSLGKTFVGASVLFFISVSFRTLDNPLCPLFSLGTHFLWHLCNAMMLYLLLAALIKNQRRILSLPG